MLAQEKPNTTYNTPDLKRRDSAHYMHPFTDTKQLAETARALSPMAKASIFGILTAIKS